MTAKELAKILGLSEASVSFALNGKPGVSTKTRNRILEEAEKYGIPKEDILIDGLAMTISTDSSSAETTLETIRRVREELGGNTILGVSNISFGLPQRKYINAAFLTMAIGRGLTAAILNPSQDILMI